MSEPLNQAIALTSSIAHSFTHLGDETELRKLALHYWGCILFEFRSNVLGLAAAVVSGTGSMRGNRIVPRLDFTYADALLPELARLCPTPAILAEVSRLVSEHRLILRIAGGPMEHQPAWMQRAQDLLPRHAARYNALIAGFDIEGSNLRLGDWKSQSPFVLPPPVPLSLSEMDQSTGKSVLFDPPAAETES